ncbi:MAG: alkaline phosphatase family protein [Jatrophihabitantaceae bacterium]
MGEQKHTYNRRSILKAGLGMGAVAVAGALPLGLDSAAHADTPSTLRRPNSLPFPGKAVGKSTGEFPFDHLVIVMQENHSFDNYFGMLPLRGQPAADGFSFDADGKPTNATPVNGKSMRAYHQPSFAGSTDTGSQNWNDTHRQINGGAMDGFAATGPGSMGYWDQPDLPYYYSLANTFTLANRWFCSAPCQTYPNRRFLMSGTASGLISTDIGNVTSNYPANGTIWDLLSKYKISWRNYFTDAPTSAIMFDTILKHPLNLAHIEQFYLDAALGTLPAVSLVDCNMGAVTGEVGGLLQPIKVPTFGSLANNVIESTAESEENPQDIQLGEAFVARVINSVMHGPAWKRTMVVWLYDEHGGYYDHVPPPAAVAPDDIAPMLKAGDAPGDYRLYGPRVPAIVVSPYSRPHAVTNVVHDHTSVLATIQRQWNLPALTYRDANAQTLIDFIDPTAMAFAKPPTLAKPANPLPGLLEIYCHGQAAPPAPA